MRSPREIRHRLRQEIQNLRLLLSPPRLSGLNAGNLRSTFPEPHAIALRLRGTGYSSEIKRLAERILQHRFPLFATEVATGPTIDWRRDYASGITTGLSYLRTIPYLDAKRSGDHKNVWELNRHQHLVVLAQGFLLFEERRYLDEIEQEIRDWIRANPFQRGMNWVSALEVAFRAVSWLWVLHLAGPQLPESLVKDMQHSLYLHGLHLENNLSFYYSPNTHLLGEAVALHALGVMLPRLPASSRWSTNAAEIVHEQMRAQIRSDGSHFEQSTYYQIYALDMFLFHAGVAKQGEEYRSKLARMADYVSALLGHDRRLPLFGDDDGGRWFHPYGDRTTFARATLAACNAYFGEERWPCEEADFWPQSFWWFGTQQPVRAPATSPASALFQDAGMAILRSPGCKIVVDCGGFGRGSGTHSHADTLSFTVTVGQEELLIDPGTFTYVGSSDDRNYFRGTAAHNTVQVNGTDQADPVNPFKWANPPDVRVLRWQSSEAEDILDAECCYRGFRHRRRLHFLKAFAILIVDEIAGPPGEYLVQQHWHLASPDAAPRFIFSSEGELLAGWRSQCFGQREPSPVLCASKTSKLPAVMAAAIRLSDEVEIQVKENVESIDFTIDLPAEKKHLLINYRPLLR